MRSNVTLIGMPGAGKSTVGIILAKTLGLGFIDTDVLIQEHRQKTLQQILDQSDHLHLRAIEEAEVLDLAVNGQVIATGGSVAYSEKAMTHLRQISTIVFLQVSFGEIKRRIRNFATRGIAKAKNQTFHELFDERQILYNRYADIIIPCDGLDQEEVCEAIARALH